MRRAIATMLIAAFLCGCVTAPDGTVTIDVDSLEAILLIMEHGFDLWLQYQERTHELDETEYERERARQEAEIAALRAKIAEARAAIERSD